MSQQIDSRFSRRDVMQAGLLAGIGTALPGPLLAAGGGTPVITRAIPSTGERIPLIGVGTDRFGDADSAAVRDVLKRMYELGGTVVDTAGLYAGSEQIIGPALRELKLRPKVFLSTKVNAAGATNDPPHDLNARQPPDPVSGLDSFHRSLERLQTDKVDLLSAHWLSSVEPLMSMLLDLKKTGRVRYIGITTITSQQHPRLAQFMRKYPLDFVQVDYSLADHSADEEVLPLALERKIAVTAAIPFGGARNLLFSQIGKRQLPAWAADFDIASWGQFFLKYVVSHPAITCAIPGSTNVSHLEDNQAAGRGRLPDAATRKNMEAFWEGKA